MAQITVSGHIQSVNGSTASTGTITFTLVNYGDNLPRVLGTGALIPIAVSASTSSGAWSITNLWGNDSIDPGGTLTPPTTFYSVTFQVPGQPSISLPFQFTGAGPFNLDSQAPLQTPPNPAQPSQTIVLTAAAPTVAASQVGLGSTTATSATAGANGAVPAQVVGYLIINVAGTAMKVPYYNV